MVKFGTQTIPYVQEWRLQYTRLFTEKPIPGRSTAYREDSGALGVRISLSFLVYPANYTTKDNIRALSDGTTRTLDFELTGMPTYDCLMLEPEYEPEPVDSTNAIVGRLEFLEEDN